MSIYSSKPRCSGSQKIFTVSDAIDSLKAFNAVYAVNRGFMSKCDENHEATAWRAQIRDGVIHCGGEPVELDFFTKIAGDATTITEAKDMYIRYRCDRDLNIFAQLPVTGSAAGAAVTFQLLKGLHSGHGKYSYPAKGYSIYIYEDRQWVMITNVDKTTDFAHKVTVVPLSKSYTVNIRSNSKMMIMPVRLIGNYSCSEPNNSLTTPTYVNKVQPIRIRKDWEVAIDLMRGYSDIIQFAIDFDENGNEMDCWEAIEKMNARRDVKIGINLLAFLGQRTDNPTLFSDMGLTADYAGFDGYLPSVEYAGGNLIDIDPGIGFDLESDFEPLIMRNDSIKQTNEYVVMHAKPFMASLSRNSERLFRSSGQCTWETFKRMSEDPEMIKRHGVKSYSWLGFTLHFKEISALSDSRYLGNHFMPNMGMMIPGNGLRDSKGNSVPPIEFFAPEGCQYSGQYTEVDRDHLKLENGCEKISGTIMQTQQMAVHCVRQHVLINPVKQCA